MKCKFCNTTVEKPTFDIGNTAISNTMDNQLAMGVLNDALAKHPHPEIFNTDQGSQYTSEVHTQRLKNLGITISMDGKGRATDNICIERIGGWKISSCSGLTNLDTKIAL